MTVCTVTVALGRKSVVVRVSVGADANGEGVVVGSQELFTRPPSCTATVGIDSRYSTNAVGGNVEMISDAGYMSEA